MKNHSLDNVLPIVSTLHRSGLWTQQTEAKSSRSENQSVATPKDDDSKTLKRNANIVGDSLFVHGNPGLTHLSHKGKKSAGNYKLLIKFQKGNLQICHQPTMSHPVFHPVASYFPIAGGRVFYLQRINQLSMNVSRTHYLMG